MTDSLRSCLNNGKGCLSSETIRLQRRVSVLFFLFMYISIEDILYSILFEGVQFFLAVSVTRPQLLSVSNANVSDLSWVPCGSFFRATPWDL